MIRLVAHLSLVLGLFGLVFAWANGLTSVWASHDPGSVYCAQPEEMEMVRLINDFRAGRGLEPLGLSEPLGSAAEHKSQAMAANEFFTHISPDGVTPRELIAEHGYLHNTATGENIAAGQERAAATFAQWQESAAHRELMLDEAFTAIGVARAYNVESRYDWYWTAEFGGVLAAPAQPCDAAPGTPTAIPGATPAPADGIPVELLCEGVRLDDGTYELTCRPA